MEISGSNEVSFTVGPGEGDRYLRTFLENARGLSVKALRKLKHHGQVTVNGEPALLIRRIREGDEIVLRYPPENASPYLRPFDVPVEIVYEDKDIVVLNKQAGICVHPTRGHPLENVANGLLYYWRGRGEECYPHFVGRLDRDTSGVLLVAKNSYCAQQFFSQQLAGEVGRRYTALVAGSIRPGEGTIDLPIARVDETTTRREVNPGGQPAVTHYRVLERLPGYTLLSINLETGRTHQIRVHFSHLGHPLVGDYLYGGETGLLNRQFLHADGLNFWHPLHAGEMEFNLKLPAELEKALGVLRTGNQ